MAEQDWAKMPGSLDPADVSVGQTDNVAFQIPEGVHCVGFHSLNAVVGFTGYVLNLSGFNPISGHKGGIIKGYMRKHVVGTGGAAVFFFVTSTNAQGAEGYMLGISEDNPAQLILRKGMLNQGLSISSPGVLRVSQASYPNPTWLYPILYMTVNTQGDVALRVRQSVLSIEVAIPGMDDIVDDVLGKASGSPPVFGDFYPGFGHYNSGQSGRLSLFDALMASRQLTP